MRLLKYENFLLEASVYAWSIGCTMEMHLQKLKYLLIKLGLPQQRRRRFPSAARVCPFSRLYFWHYSRTSLRSIASGSVDATFVLALPYHQGDLEPDCVGVSTRSRHLYEDIYSKWLKMIKSAVFILSCTSPTVPNLVVSSKLILSPRV